MKIAAGIFYGWFGHTSGTSLQMVDTWSYHERSLVEYDILLTRPAEYFTNIFHTPHPNGYLNFFGSTQSYWNDLKADIFIKLLSVFDILSFGNYYTNVIFYSFLSLYGPCALYRVLKESFPDKKKLLVATVFFVPSFFYWANGLHKEGLIFTAIALIIYHLHHAEQEKRFSRRRIFGIALGLLIILLLRNFILVVIVPAMVAWLAATRFPDKKLLAYSGVFAAFFILFFTLPLLHPKLDFPAAVAEKQQAFLSLTGGNSAIPMRPLEPSFAGFMKNTPQAISLTILRPFPADIRHADALAAAIEIWMFLLLCIVAVLIPDRRRGRQVNAFYFSLFFSAWLLLAIGFSVNNLGAISRYRSIVIPLMVSAVVVCIDWSRVPGIKRLISKNSNLKFLAP